MTQSARVRRTPVPYFILHVGTLIYASACLASCTIASIHTSGLDHHMYATMHSNDIPSSRPIRPDPTEPDPILPHWWLRGDVVVVVF